MHLSFCAHLINIFSFLTGVELRHFFHLKCIGGVWFVLPVTPTVFVFYIQALHNECSHIEDVYLLFCTHFMIFFSPFLGS